MKSQKVIVILLAAVSLGTTIMIGLIVVNRSANQGDDLVLVGGAGMDGETQDPPVLVNVPDFTLTAQDGEPYGTEQLEDKAWIVAFIFTRCQGPCPMMASQMAQMQRDLSEHPRWSDIRLVCISVDPTYDTPPRLAEYARLLQADPEHWKFLTGTREEVWQLVLSGFKLPVGEADDPKMPIYHSEKFLLMDGQARLRGLYDGLEPEGRAELKADLDQVLAEM